MYQGTTSVEPEEDVTPLAALAAEQPIPQGLKAFELNSALAPARLKGDALTLRNDSANFCQGNHGRQMAMSKLTGTEQRRTAAG